VGPGFQIFSCRANVAVAVVDDRIWAVGGFSGKIFLNSIEQLDPASDEWTTFVTVPEKSISPTKSSLSLNVLKTENGTHDQYITTNNEDQSVNLKNTNRNENEDGIFFEMDLEPLENKEPGGETLHVENIPSPYDSEILQESTGNTLTSSSEDTTLLSHEHIVVQKNEAISKHVLSTNLDNVSPSDKCAFCDQSSNPCSSGLLD
jgi:hypothetical protein